MANEDGKRSEHHGEMVRRLLDLPVADEDVALAWTLRELVEFDELIEPGLERARIDEMARRLKAEG